MEYVILLPNLFMDVWVGMVGGIPLQAGQALTLVDRGDHRHAFAQAAFATRS